MKVPIEIRYDPEKIMAATTSIFKKISSIQKHYVNIFCTEFHTNPLPNMEIADRNSFTLLNKTGSVRINGNFSFGRGHPVVFSCTITVPSVQSNKTL